MGHGPNQRYHGDHHQDEPEGPTIGPKNEENGDDQQAYEDTIPNQPQSPGIARIHLEVQFALSATATQGEETGEERLTTAAWAAAAPAVL